MNVLKLTSLLAVGLLLPTAALASDCPTFAGDPITSAASGGTFCNVLITIGTTGAVTITAEDVNHPYDNRDDQLIGVIDNYSGGTVTSLTLTGSGAIFGFDGDGISTKTHDATDSTGYGGPDNTFSHINGAKTSGEVDFTSALTNGTITYFSLEQAPTGGSDGLTVTVGGTAPEPSSLLLLGTGLVGMAATLRRRIVSAVR